MIDTLAQALAERGYEHLTDVQKAVTDPDLIEADMLVSAQTGSGKTVGFGLAIAPTLLPDGEKFDRPAAPLALVIAPTRELAFQVMRELAWLYGKAGAVVTSCVGGMDMRDERRALDRGAHIVVATPGRLRDHIQRGSLDMTSLRAVVLDEADEMLDLGFSEDLEFILAAAPAERRTLMFSATVPPAIATLAKTYQHDAVRVSVTAGKGQHADIAYRAMSVADADAENAIINVLRFHDAENAIVFANTRAMVSRLAARFSNRGFSVVSLSGELSQSERTHALQAMRDGRARVCVATDVAARGIDLPGLDLVVHAELPSNPETLLHRSGRTGRAGRKGISALIVPPKARKKAERILKFAKITAEWTVPPSAEDIRAKDSDRLLNDPAWDTPISDTEAEFSARLLELHSPEKIAAAYLRLFQKGVSAPEDLSDPATVSAPRPRPEFGDSKWFSLSVGRAQRAEPRWILPLLCRAGNIDKDALGAIRVQETETFVEIAETAVAGFLAAVGPGMSLEDGMVLKALDSKPDVGAPPPRGPRPDRGPRPEKSFAPRAERSDAPRAEAAAKPKSDWQDKPKSDWKDKPRPDWKDKPRAPRPDKPVDRPRTDIGGKRDADAPRKPRSKPADRTAPRSAEGWSPDTRPDKAPYKPREDRGEAKAARPSKPFARAGKPSGEKRFAKPAAEARPAARASDTSQRFVPPGAAAKPRGKPGAKPGGKPRGPGGKAPRGGNAFPKRGKP